MSRERKHKTLYAKRRAKEVAVLAKAIVERVGRPLVNAGKLTVESSATSMQTNQDLWPENRPVAFVPSIEPLIRLPSSTSPLQLSRNHPMVGLSAGRLKIS